MERFHALSRGSKVMLIAGVLLLIDTFFAWQQVEILDIEASQNAWNGFFGVMLGLLTAALVAWLVVNLTGVELRLPVSEAMLSAILAGVILLFTLIKVLDDDFTAFWAYAGLVLAAIVAIGAWLNVQDAGGVETLRSEASGLKDAATTSSAELPPRRGSPSRHRRLRDPTRLRLPRRPIRLRRRPHRTRLLLPPTRRPSRLPRLRHRSPRRLHRTFRMSGRASPKAACKGRLLYSRRKGSSTGTP